MSENEDRVPAASNRTRTRIRSALRVTGIALIWLALAVGAVVIGSVLWVQRTFGDISIDQMLMHLPGAGGAEVTGAENGYISTFVLQAIVLPLVAVLVLWGVWMVLWKRPMHSRRRALENHEEAVPAAPAKRWALVVAPALLATAALLVGGTMTWQTFRLTEYQQSVLSTMDMADYYVVPPIPAEGIATASGEQTDTGQRNLVMIYLESADAAFGDEERFEQNMYASLDRTTAGWASIPALRLYEGGGWTMAGLVGTQCGVPLRGPGLGMNDINSNEIGAEQEGYLASAVCLGDALGEAGYTNVFLGGADAQFASKGEFLSAHGYDEVKDLHHWNEIGESEFLEWGLSDRALMEQAKAEVARLHDSGEPFNLTLLTLDFHEPLHVADYCQVTTEEPLSSVLRCSNDQVAGFVDYMEEMGYLEDTAVVIMGDHPKMIAQGGAYASELSGVPLKERVLYNRIWSPDGVDLAREDIDQLSMYATILDLLNLGRGDHRAGLGVSALVEPPVGSALADLTAEQYGEMLRSRSGDFYRMLWGLGSADAVVAEADHD